MRKTLLLVMVCGSLLVACSGPKDIAPIATSASPSLTKIPSLQPTLPTLLAEKDLKTETGTSYSLDWSPDGETLAVASGVEITLLNDDLSKIITVLKPSNGALTATWNADQKRIATVVGFRNPTITIWDWDIASAQLTQARQISAGSDQYGASWSPDGKLLATLANDRKSNIQIWDTSTWELLNQFDLPYANPRRALNWSADGKTVYDAGELNGQVVYFGLDVEDGSVEELGKLSIEEVYAFTISSDLKKIAAAEEGGKVRIIDIVSGTILTEFQSVNTPVDLAWNPKTMTLAILGYETVLQLWDVTLQ